MVLNVCPFGPMHDDVVPTITASYSVSPAPSVPLHSCFQSPANSYFPTASQGLLSSCCTVGLPEHSRFPDSLSSLNNIHLGLFRDFSQLISLFYFRLELVYIFTHFLNFFICLVFMLLFLSYFLLSWAVYLWFIVYVFVSLFWCIV